MEDGILNLAAGDEVYMYFPETNATDVYEYTYDIKAPNSASYSRLVTYEYAIPGSGVSPNSANFGAYYPGTGFCIGRTINGDCSGAAFTDVDKWYTVTVEWCGAEDNRYLYYKIADRDTGDVLTTKMVRGKWINAQGEEVVRYNKMQSMMFWNHALAGSSTFQLDNFVVKQLPYGYSQKTYYPQVWADGTLANQDTVFRSGVAIEAQAYAPNSGSNQMIVAAYDANDELLGTKVIDSSIRDEFKVNFTIEAEDGFDGASYVKAFLLGTGNGFKPITNCYNSAAVPAAQFNKIKKPKK